MKKELFVRIDYEVYQQLEKACNEKKLGKAEIIEKALRLFLSNPDTEKTEKSDLKAQTWSKPLPLKYPNKFCIKCKRKLEIGELVLISKTERGYQYLCYECFLKVNLKSSTEAKQLFKLYKQIKRLKALKAQAQKELDELVVKINRYEIYDYLKKKIDELNPIINDLFSYLYKVESDNIDLKKIAENVREIKEKIEQFLALESLRERKKVRSWA